MRKLRRWVGVATSLSVGLGVAVLSACAGEKGAIMLAITTDMQAPKDVNAVSLTILTNNVPKFNTIARVTPEGDVLLPATIAIVEPEDPSASIRIRVMAFKNNKAMVLRDVRTSVPQGGRTALLRLPLNFVNTGSVEGANALPDGIVPAPNPGSVATSDLAPKQETSLGGEFPFEMFVSSGCTPDETWIDGVCKDAFIDSSTLPDYVESEVFGAAGPGGGACFDVARCFANAKGFEVEPSSCILESGGADPSNLNISIVTGSIGKCIAPGECFVPVDRGEGGWEVVNGKVQLPPYVCTLLAKGNRLSVSDGTCAAKTAANPVCQDAQGGDGPIVLPDGGPIDGSVAPMAQLFIPENNPSGVAIVGNQLFFAGPNRVAMRDVSKQGDPGTPLPNVPPTDTPWNMRAVQGANPAVLIANGSDKAWVGQNGEVTTVNFPAAQIVDGDWRNDTSFLWASPGMGLYESTGTNGYVYDGGSVGFNPLSVATVNNSAFIVSSLAGDVRGCINGVCGPLHKVTSSPIDRLVTVAGQPIGAALGHDGVYKLTVNPTTGVINSERIAQNDTSPIIDGPAVFPRGLALGGPCAFFGSSIGLNAVTIGPNPQSTTLWTAPAGASVLGITTGRSPAGMGTGPSVYFAVHAPLGQGGGIYVMSLPNVCGGTGGGGGGGGGGGLDGGIQTAEAGTMEAGTRN